MKDIEYKYNLKLTENQAKILSRACNVYSRLICGQDREYQDLFEAAWEKRCKKATGRIMDEDFEGGWYVMREDAEKLCKEIKKKFWGLDYNTSYGVNYDETSDILFDLYQVIRHQLWLDRPEDKKSPYTVDASEALQFAQEPLASIEKIK